MHVSTRNLTILSVVLASTTVRADDELARTSPSPTRLRLGLQYEGTRGEHDRAALGIGPTLRAEHGDGAFSLSFLRMYDEGSALDRGWHVGARAHHRLVGWTSVFGGVAYERWAVAGEHADALIAEAGLSGTLPVTDAVAVFGELGVAQRLWLDGGDRVDDGVGLELKSGLGFIVTSH